MSNKAKKAFEFLKSKIIDKVAFSNVDSEATLIIETDGVGAVLLQKHKDNKINTLIFAS